MTISSTTNRNDYVGNGATSVYSYSFKIFAESKGFWYKKGQNMDYDCTITNGVIEQRANITLELDEANFPFYPYTDTMSFTNLDSNVISNMEEVRRFYDSINRIENKKKYKELEMTFDYHSTEALKNLQNYNVVVSEKLSK